MSVSVANCIFICDKDDNLLTIGFQLPDLKRTMTHTCKPAVSEIKCEIFNGSSMGTGKRCKSVIVLLTLKYQTGNIATNEAYLIVVLNICMYRSIGAAE